MFCQPGQLGNVPFAPRPFCCRRAVLMITPLGKVYPSVPPRFEDPLGGRRFPSARTPPSDLDEKEEPKRQRRADRPQRIGLSADPNPLAMAVRHGDPAALADRDAL